MNETDQLAEESAVNLTEVEEHDVEDHVAQRSPVIFEIIRRTGEEELNRPWFSLWWSGLAAGVSIGFSVLTQAYLQSYLDASPTSLLISKLGYSVGFVIVILAHQQLFTENTLTAVVPLLAHPHRSNALRVLRLWTIVFFANMTGALVFALFLAKSGGIASGVYTNIREISLHSLSFTPAELVMRGLGAGFIIASLVWILANVDQSKLAIIILLTYIVAIGDLAHVVAGSVEAAFLVLDGARGSLEVIVRFVLPTLFGNVIGGTALFALLSYGQIHKELNSETAD